MERKVFIGRKEFRLLRSNEVYEKMLSVRDWIGIRAWQLGLMMGKDEDGNFKRDFPLSKGHIRWILDAALGCRKELNEFIRFLNKELKK